MGDVRDDYFRDGYALLQALVAPDTCRLLMHRIKTDTGDAPLPLSSVREFPNLLIRPAFEVHSRFYAPLDAFLWGLTPRIADLTGLSLVPTYCYFRIYREGDVCRVHSDRQACEHSLSLTLDYSDGEGWPLEVSPERLDAPSAFVAEDFGSAPSTAIIMEPGDAVLYKGTHHRHGRTMRNPNGWSAHLFLHWVDANGPYAEFAHDQRPVPPPVNFSFA
jgi:hypothetical protein